MRDQTYVPRVGRWILNHWTIRGSPHHIVELYINSLLIKNLVQFSHSVRSNSLRPHGLQHARLPCLITSSQSLLKLVSIESVMPSILPSVVHFSSCFQSFPSSEYFPRRQFFASGGLSIGVSASASVLPMNIQD